MSDCFSSRHRCDACYGALSDYLDGLLPEAEQRAIEAHLQLCPPCLIYMEQFRRVKEATGQVRAEDLPADFDDVMSGVLAAWKAKRAEGGPRSA
jgi:anti-sigma factor RsiW